MFISLTSSFSISIPLSLRPSLSLSATPICVWRESGAAVTGGCNGRLQAAATGCCDRWPQRADFMASSAAREAASGTSLPGRTAGSYTTPRTHLTRMRSDSDERAPACARPAPPTSLIHPHERTCAHASGTGADDSDEKRLGWEATRMRSDSDRVLGDSDEGGAPDGDGGGAVDVHVEHLRRPRPFSGGWRAVHGRYPPSGIGYSVEQRRSPAIPCRSHGPGVRGLAVRVRPSALAVRVHHAIHGMAGSRAALQHACAYPP